MKKLSVFFGILAVLLSDIMCAVVAYDYCTLLWSGRCGESGAPASTAFLLIIPYAVGIAASAALAIIFRKKAVKQQV